MMRPLLGAVVALTCLTGTALTGTAMAQTSPMAAPACPAGYTADPTLGRDGIFYQGHTCWRLSVAPDPSEVQPDRVATPEDVDPMRADGVGHSGRMPPDMPRMYDHDEEAIVGSEPTVRLPQQ